MDTDTTTSDETSSDYSTESSEDDGMENAEIDGVKLQLPQGFCERKDIFLDILSTETWNSLSDSNRAHLDQFLPKFPENDAEEKNKTLEKLFGCENFRFNSPLDKFHEELKHGHFRPDIANMRKIIKRAERKEAAYRYKKYRERLKNDVLASQAKLIDQINNLPPGIEPKCEKIHDPNLNFLVHRTKRRYFQVLATIQAQTGDGCCSPDENYPEGPPLPLSRKQRRHLNSVRNNHTSADMLFSTVSTKLNGLDLEKYVTPVRNPFYITDDAYKNLISAHKRRKIQLPDEPEYNTKGIALTDIVNRTQLPYIKNLTVTPSKQQAENNHKNHRKRPKKVIRNHFFHNHSSNSDIETDSDTNIDVGSVSIPITTPKTKIKTNRAPKSAPTPSPPIKIKPEIIKKEVDVEVSIPKVTIPKQSVPLTPIKIEQSILASPLKTPNSYNYEKITPVTISDLEGIDVMDIPIDLDNSSIDILELNNKPELMQETHSNFLSLIRDIVCSTNEHRMTLSHLENRLRAWQENPISPLNDWYSAHNWTNLLQNAVDFLIGNSAEQPDDFVPYMEYKPSMDMYQWIGAGRDSDALLAPLCRHWLEHRFEAKQAAAAAAVDPKEVERGAEPELEVADRSQTPPPPRFPTNWNVRKASPDEVKEFREQERRRYDNPHKAFTYRCNGYESVVGPLKGIYNAAVTSSTKARGHTMLSADRPNFVTILSLVRDATARLPNGEGTRADICELLKSSQYISSAAPDNVLQSVVSGALDRMHTQFDPCVKYDPKRKIWIYLHRNRSEEDFERIHQQYQGVNRSSKKVGGGKKAATKPRPRPDRAKPAKAEVAKPKSEPNNSLLIANQDKLQQQQQVADEKEISEALQAIVQNRATASPGKVVVEKKQSFMKIISPGQGKSLIIPQQGMKQQQEVVRQQQQLLQSLQQAKLKSVQKKDEDVGIEVKALPQQFIQSITPQQLQNIKNVTLVRGLGQGQGELKLAPGSLPEQIQIKTQTALTPAQQQQILATIKQKMLPAGAVLSTQQQQIVLKQKLGQKGQILATGPTKINLEPSKSVQNPVVAKVLTNAAGQVISVESLLAHQKQHGSLPHGTTLRVSGTKGGQPNIIQLTGTTTKPNQIAQFAVGSQNNIIITSQPKLVVATPSTTTLPSSSSFSSSTIQTIMTTTNTKAVSRTILNKNQPNLATSTIQATKFPPKIAQQLINAKLIATNQTLDQKMVHSKLFMNQAKLATTGKSISLSTKPVTIANTNTIRMVNAANLNLTHIGGKPVLLASKGATIQNLQGQNMILQTQSGGSNPLVIQKTLNQAQANLLNQNVVLGQQLKVQTPQQVVFSSGKGVVQATTNSIVASMAGSQHQHVMLDGHPVRLQTSTASSTQRVVLASQAQGGQIVAQQILLPAGFQGTAINIKALQGVKVIPLSQAQGRGMPGRQVFARVMSPSVVKAAPVSTPSDKSPPDQAPSIITSD